MKKNVPGSAIAVRFRSIGSTGAPEQAFVAQNKLIPMMHPPKVVFSGLRRGPGGRCSHQPFTGDNSTSEALALLALIPLRPHMHRAPHPAASGVGTD